MMYPEDKRAAAVLFIILLVIVGGTATIGHVASRPTPEPAGEEGKFLYSVTWRSGSGEERVYEHTSRPRTYIHDPRTYFSLPDGTQVQIQEGAVEIKRQAEKP